MKQLLFVGLLLLPASAQAMELNKDVLTQVAKFADKNTLVSMSLVNKESKAGVDQLKVYYFKNVDFPLGALGDYDFFMWAIDPEVCDLHIVENMSRYLVDPKETFIDAARDGKLFAVKWLFATQPIDNKAVYHACMAAAGGGHTETLTWLYKTAGAALDAKQKNDVLETAYMFEEYDTARWIAQNMQNGNN